MRGETNLTPVVHLRYCVPFSANVTMFTLLCTLLVNSKDLLLFFFFRVFIVCVSACEWGVFSLVEYSVGDVFSRVGVVLVLLCFSALRACVSTSYDYGRIVFSVFTCFLFFVFFSLNAVCV